MSDFLEVELHAAFVFTCPNCDQDMFIRAPVIEDPQMQEEAASLMREMLSLTAGEDAAENWSGELTMVPEIVNCEHCQAAFRVAAPALTLGEDDEAETGSESETMFLDDEEDYDPDGLEEEDFDSWEDPSDDWEDKEDEDFEQDADFDCDD